MIIKKLLELKNIYRVLCKFQSNIAVHKHIALQWITGHHTHVYNDQQTEAPLEYPACSNTNSKCLLNKL